MERGPRVVDATLVQGFTVSCKVSLLCLPEENWQKGFLMEKLLCLPFQEKTILQKLNLLMFFIKFYVSGVF